MLDQLMPAARHFVITVILVPILGVIGAFANAVITAGGLAVDWAGVWAASLDAAVVLAMVGLLAWLALYITPLTRQYGLFQDQE